ncbi:MAG: ATP:cob(I)alamin adenosyltransferase [Candidatus Izemoplasma sp.]|nr:ATP:cob(I)alamin adenosyltransferase [Candidatus Izemoplasma sp.]
MTRIDDYKMISTKKGDKGTSKNYSNEAFSKSDTVFDTLGVLDELSSFLGLSYHYTPFKDDIKTIQTTIQHINSLIATNPDDTKKRNLAQISDEDIDKLEAIEARAINDTNIQPKFVLPGSESTKPGAYLGVCRALARKAERQVNRFYEVKQRDKNDLLLAYLNRLSDVLFILARSQD